MKDRAKDFVTDLPARRVACWSPARVRHHPTEQDPRKQIQKSNPSGQTIGWSSATFAKPNWFGPINSRFEVKHESLRKLIRKNLPRMTSTVSVNATTTGVIQKNSRIPIQRVLRRRTDVLMSVAIRCSLFLAGNWVSSTDVETKSLP